MKILSPAGDFKSLKCAVFAGADEVYIGVNKFNARNNVDSFTIENLKEAVDFAHIYNVKVSLAVNILFTDEEILDAVSLCVKAHNLGVDSIIICDLGLAKILSSQYPEIVLHASTQMGIHNLEGVLALKQFNFKRVVLSRETPLSEIKRIKQNSNVEIEYFAHGALCVCFSGNCYMSAKLFNASGNRGKCKQLCRLPFSLNFKGKTLKKGFLLSAKDFNMLSRLSDLENAGVDVIKIEGRARRPFYVYTSTRAYRNVLDGKSYNEREIDLAFNRGFNEGYFNGNGNMISEFNNHVGIKIGKVEKIIKGKRFNEVYIICDYPLSPKSTLKFFVDGMENAVVSPFDVKKTANGYCFTTTSNVLPNSEVHLINDAKAEEEVEGLSKKIDCEISVFAFSGEPIKAEFKVYNQSFTLIGNPLSSAKSQPLTLEELKDNFAKSEFFKPSVCLHTDGVFILKKQLNSFRREVYEKAFNLLTAKHYKNLKLQALPSVSNLKRLGDFQVVDDACQSLTAKHVIYSPETYDANNVIKINERCTKNNAKLYLDTPNFALEKDIELLEDIINKTGVGVVANNPYALSLSDNLIIGAGLNVFNHHSASLFNAPVLTFESDLSDFISYPFMTLRHCPFKSHLNFKCSDCKYEKGYEYVMTNGKSFKLKRKKLTDCTFYLTE